MKKGFLAILAVLYMTVSSGIAMEIHYCMGKKAGMEFYGSSSDKCGKCGMTEKDTGCCHDEHKFYKLQDSHKTVSNDIHFMQPEFALVSEYPLFNSKLPADPALTAVNNHSPPEYAGPSACILNCVFRI
ncbi:MAG TPA: hypothetical protein VK484_00620 [Ferruginibacter sp.]|nr:hypothetical protein [Ferruginibacter sp.]